MTSLYFTLYENTNKIGGYKAFSDDDKNSNGVIDFGDFKNRATLIAFTPAADYRIGDHLILLSALPSADARGSHWPDCDAVAVDPNVSAEVALTDVTFNNDQTFAGHGVAALFVRNPNPK